MLGESFEAVAKLWEAIEVLGGIHVVVYFLLGGWIVYLLTAKSYDIETPVTLTKEEKEECLREWEPEPLVRNLNEQEKLDLAQWNRTVTSPPGKHVVVNGRPLLNMATYNFHEMSNNKSVVEAAIRCLRRYGPGSCGPRGFYGTFDIHVELEKVAEQYLGCEKTILYSSGYALVASVIAAFATRSDFLIIDDACRHAIQAGVVQSRSRTFIYKNNDLVSLEQKMKECLGSVKRHGVPGRRYLIVEGVNQNTGRLCPLRDILPLALKYKFRIILDESHALGVIGKTGRGTIEHFGLTTRDVDLVVADIGNAFGALGGICFGREKLINHQGVNGSGYVFSASNPPMLVGGAVEAFRQLEESPEMVEDLQRNSNLAQELLEKCPALEISSHSLSPIKILRLAERYRKESTIDQCKQLDDIVSEAEQLGLCLVRGRHTTNDRFTPLPSIRLTLMSTMTHDEVRRGTAAAAAAFEKVGSGTVSSPLASIQLQVDVNPGYQKQDEENDFQQSVAESSQEEADEVKERPDETDVEANVDHEDSAQEEAGTDGNREYNAESSSAQAEPEADCMAAEAEIAEAEESEEDNMTNEDEENDIIEEDTSAVHCEADGIAQSNKDGKE